jgi:hypothetical protein
MILKAIKKIVETQTSLLQKKAGTYEEVECSIDNEVVECDEMEHPYLGVPAPLFLEDDPWFGPVPNFTEKQEVIRAQLEQEEQLIAAEEDKSPDKEVANIHQVMYDIATKGKATTLALDPIGGSENFHEGPGGWNSGTGANQFRS